MQLLEQVDAAIQDRRLIAPRDRVVIAVSGGLDSMVLLHLLHRLAEDYHWHLSLAHLNHQLRGRASRADELRVRKTAERLFLPCSTERADVRALAREERLSLEMAGRRLRHAFLARNARARRARRLALAHHAQDQVELFFLRLLRGAGPGGLAGMKWSNPSPADPGLTLIRPLLDQPRSALESYARHHRIRYREDASNRSTDILRNRIRHVLLPLLESEFQPALTSVVLREIDMLAAEDDLLVSALKDTLSAPSTRSWSHWPVALQRRHLHSQLIELGVTPEFTLVEALRKHPGNPVTVAPQRTLCRDAQGIVQANPSSRPSFQPEEQEVELSRPGGSITFGETVLAWKHVRAHAASPPPSESATEWFDADRVGRKVILRHWRRGDRFQPSGMPRPVKLQDLFTNLKISPAERRKRLVAATPAGDIWWVQGLRIAETFKLRPGTRHRLRWHWTPA